MRRLAVEDRVELSLLGERLEVGAGIGHDRELLRVLVGHGPEVFEMGARLECGPRLGGGDEERPSDVDRLLQPPDRCRMRRVEDVEVGRVEAAPEDLRRQARAAHSEQDVVLVLADRRGREVELTEGLVQPAKPLILVRAGPDGGVARPDPLDELLPLRHAETSSPRLDSIPSINSVNESLNFSTPSRSSVALTSS